MDRCGGYLRICANRLDELDSQPYLLHTGASICLRGSTLDLHVFPMQPTNAEFAQSQQPADHYCNHAPSSHHDFINSLDRQCNPPKHYLTSLRTFHAICRNLLFSKLSSRTGCGCLVKKRGSYSPGPRIGRSNGRPHLLSEGRPNCFSPGLPDCFSPGLPNSLSAGLPKLRSASV